MNGQTTRCYSLDTLPQEYSCFGTGDYRITALQVRNPDGGKAASLRFRSCQLLAEKYSIPGLPALHAQEGQGETLVLHMEDSVSGLEVELYYGVLEEADIITRAVRIINLCSSAEAARYDPDGFCAFISGSAILCQLVLSLVCHFVPLFWLQPIHSLLPRRAGGSLCRNIRGGRKLSLCFVVRDTSL